MNAKEFRDMYQQMLAFNALMKGELKAELEAAQTAIDDAGGVQEIETAKAKLAKDQSDFEAYKEVQNAALDEMYKEIQEGKLSIEAAQDKLKSDQKDLIDAKEAHAADKDAFSVEKSRHVISVKNDRAEIEKQNIELSQQQMNLNKALQSIKEREDAVNAKLAAIKQLA